MLFSDAVAHQIISTMIPTTVKGSSCHQPDLPISCNRLDITAKLGMTITMPMGQPIKGIHVKDTSKRVNKTNHQNSDLRTLPLNWKYFL